MAQLFSLDGIRVMENSNKATGVSGLAPEWPVILLFVCLAVSPSVVRHFFDRAWGVVAAVAVFAVWLVIRPWRFKFLPQHSRRGIFIAGTVALAMLVLVHGLLYWFSQWLSQWLAQNVAMLPNPALEPTAIALSVLTGT